jgi:hypothetical protein
MSGPVTVSAVADVVIIGADMISIGTDVVIIGDDVLGIGDGAVQPFGNIMHKHRQA